MPEPAKPDAATPEKAPWRISRREIIPADTARVWRALTDPSELSLWWCDSASVEARKGGVYIFGGPHVFGGGADLSSEQERGPAQKPGDFEILDLVLEKKLQFRWWLGEVKTRVTYELMSFLELTQLTVFQESDTNPGWDPDPDTPNWWWVSLHALRSYVENGKPDLCIDYDATQKAARIEFEVGVFTFPWIIWSKLTDPGELNRWWGINSEVDLRPGGAFRLELEGKGPQKVIEVEPGRRLVHDWTWGKGPPATVEWTIEETGDATRLSVRDRGPWNPEVRRDFLAVYWAARLLNLKRMSERGISPRENQVG